MSRQQYPFAGDDSAPSPLDQRPPNPFPTGQPPSFKTNVNRMKTKRWVEAKSYSYDGDDWGDEYDDYDEPALPLKPTGLRQQGHAGGAGEPSRSFTNPEAQGRPPVPRKNSFEAGDERRTFSLTSPQSSQGFTRLPQVDTTRSSSENYIPIPSGVTPASGIPQQSQGPYTQSNRVASAASWVAPSEVSETTSTGDPQLRRDFSPSALPPPLQTRMSPPPGVGHQPPPTSFPPRKSSIGQQSPLAQAPPPLSSAAEPSVEQRDRSNSNPAKAPAFIRPADIYKRIEAERQKERASLDTERPSLDTLRGRPTDESSEDQKRAESAGRSGARTSLDRVDESHEIQHQLPPLETVAERKSEYMPTYSVEGSSEAAGAGTGTIDPTMSRHETRADNSSHQRSDSDWQPTLPPVSRMSTFGDDFWKSGHSREQSVDTTTTPVPDSAPKDAAGLQHQPSLGFKSVVHQAFDRKDDSSVPPTPVSRLASGDEGGVSRSNTNSTTGISPIISRVPSTAVRARDNATPAIEEEPVDPTISRSRPNSGFYPPGVQVARKPSPNHSRNVSSESANFTPGYRRDLNTPSPNNSPARSPAIGTSLEFPVPVRGELSNTGHIDSIKKNLPSNPQAYATREADLAHDINASPEHGPKLFIDTVKQSQIGFLETHKSPPLDICPTQAPSNAIPRAESPSKGRVADLAGKFNQIDSRRNSTNSVGSRHSIDSWERESVNELPSRKGSPSKQLAPAFEPTAQQAERPTSAREQSFRPKLPGQWESFATTVDSPTPTEQEHGQGLFLNENVSPSIAPPIAQQAATPVEVSNHVNEDLDIAPTTTKHPAAAPEETKEKSPSFTENPMAALAAAGAAMGDAIKASVGFDHSDEDRGSQSEVNRTVTDVPETSKDGQAKGRFVGDIYIRPLTLDRTASSVASSSPPTPPPKDESNKTISNIHSEESKLPSGLTSKDSHEPMMFNTSPSLGRPPILSQLSTDYSPNDEESDRLRKELVRTLSPIKSENDGKHNAGPALAHLTVENTSQPVNRESSILPAEYDTYWAGKFDDSEDDSTTPVKRSLETTRAPPAIQVPSSIATDTHQLSNQRPEVPHEQPSSAASVSEISRSEARFSWETGTEQLNQPSIASTLGSPAPVSSTYDQVASATAESPAHSESPADRSFDEKLPAPSDEHPAMRDTSVLATHPQTEAEIISHVPPPVSKVPDDQRASREGLHVVNAEPGEVPDPEPPAQVFQSGHSEDANPAVDNHKSLPSHHSRVVPLGFREILALKSTAERITTYNKTREQFAGMDTGIHHWINSTIANQPEHAYLASLPLRPTVTTTGLTGTGKHKSSPSISRFNKHSPGSGQASGSHGQQPFDSTTSSPAVNHPPQSQYSTPSPSGNKLSGHQMQAKLLKNASVLGGKATTGAKGLFAKGKSRFRSSGSEKDFLPQRHHSISSFDIAHNRSPSVTDKKKKRLSSPFSRRSQSRPTSIVLPITTDFSDFERNTPMSEGAVGRHRTSYIDTGRVESWNLPEPPPIPDTDDIDRLGVLPSPATEHFKQEFNVSAEQRLNAVEKEERILQSVVRNSTPNMSRSQTPDLNQGQSKHERRISVGTVGTGSELNWPLGDVSAKELREVRRSVDIPVPPLPQVEVKLKSFDADDSITDSPGDDVLPHSQVHGDVARSDSPKTVLSGEEESTDLQARPRLQSRNPLTRSGTHAVSSLRLDNSAVQSQPSKSLVRSATLGTVSSIESPELGRSYTHKTVSEMALSDGIPPVSEVSATATTPKLAALSQPPSRVSTPDSWEGKREQTLTEENLKELLEGRHPIRHPSLSSLGAEDRPDYHTETGNNLRIPGAFLETPAGELEESFHDDLHPVASESAEISTAEVQTVKYTLATPTSITLESPSNRTGLKTSPINQEPASVDNQSPPHEQPTASTPERVTLRRYNTNDLYGETPVVSPVRNSFLEREKEVETNGPNIEPRPATPDRPMSFVMLPRDGGVPQDRINRDSDSSDDDDDDDDDFEKIEHAKQFEATSQQLSPEPNQTQGDSYNHQRGVSGVTEHPGRASFGKAQWTGFAHPSKEMSDTSTIRPDRRFSGGKPHFPHIHDPTLVPRTRPPIPETGTASIEMKSVSQQDGGRMMSPQVIDPRKSSPEYQLPGIGPPSAPSVDTAQQQRPPSLLQTISNRATSTSSSAPAPPKNDRINPELTSSAHLDVGYPSVSTLEDHAMEKKKRKSSFFSAFNQPPVSSGESQRSKESTSVQPPQTSASNISDMLTDLPEAKGKSIFPFGSPTRLSTEVPEGKKKKRSSIFSGIFGRTSASTYALKPSKLLKSEPKKEEKQQKQQKPVAVPRPSGSYQQVFPQPPRLSFGSQPPNQQQGFQQRHSPGPSAPSQQHVHEQTTQPDFRPKVTQEGDQNRILTGPPGSAYETTRQQYQLQCTPTTQGEGRRSVSMPISPPANATSSPSRSEAYPPLGGYYAPPNFQTAQGYPDEKMILKAIAAQEQSSKQTARQQQETAMTRRRSSPAGSSEWQSRHNSMGLGGTTIPEERNAPSEEDQRFRPEQIQRAYTDAPNGYNYSQSSDRHIPPSNPQSTQVSAQQALEPSRTTESQPSDPRNQVSAQSMTSEARGPVPQWRIEEEPEQSIMKVNPRTSEKIEKGIQDDNSHSSNVHRCQSSEQIHLPLSVRHESTDSSFGERIISQISMQSLGESQSGAPDQSGSRSSSTSTMVSPISSRGSIPHLQSLVGGKLQGQRMGSISEGGAASTRNQSEQQRPWSVEFPPEDDEDRKDKLGFPRRLPSSQHPSQQHRHQMEQKKLPNPQSSTQQSSLGPQSGVQQASPINHQTSLQALEGTIQPSVSSQPVTTPQTSAQNPPVPPKDMASNLSLSLQPPVSQSGTDTSEAERIRAELERVRAKLASVRNTPQTGLTVPEQQQLRVEDPTRMRDRTPSPLSQILVDPRYQQSHSPPQQQLSPDLRYHQSGMTLQPYQTPDPRLQQRILYADRRGQNAPQQQQYVVSPHRQPSPNAPSHPQTMIGHYQTQPQVRQSNDPRYQSPSPPQQQRPTLPTIRSGTQQPRLIVQEQYYTPLSIPLPSQRTQSQQSISPPQSSPQPSPQLPTPQRQSPDQGSQQHTQIHQRVPSTAPLPIRINLPDTSVSNVRPPAAYPLPISPPDADIRSPVDPRAKALPPPPPPTTTLPPSAPMNLINAHSSLRSQGINPMTVEGRKAYEEQLELLRQRRQKLEGEVLAAGGSSNQKDSETQIANVPSQPSVQQGEQQAGTATVTEQAQSEKQQRQREREAKRKRIEQESMSSQPTSSQHPVPQAQAEVQRSVQQPQGFQQPPINKNIKPLLPPLQPFSPIDLPSGYQFPTPGSATPAASGQGPFKNHVQGIVHIQNPQPGAAGEDSSPKQKQQAHASRKDSVQTQSQQRTLTDMIPKSPAPEQTVVTAPAPAPPLLREYEDVSPPAPSASWGIGTSSPTPPVESAQQSRSHLTSPTLGYTPSVAVQQQLQQQQHGHGELGPNFHVSELDGAATMVPRPKTPDEEEEVVMMGVSYPGMEWTPMWDGEY